jgi:formate-dependent nitrite reductase cytochrome c552 subunit
MIKNRFPFLICLMSVIFIAACFMPGSAFSAVSEKAKGTPTVKPNNPVKVSTCLDCHATVKMLYSRGGHKNLNCALCHEVPADHVANPSEKTRPKTEFSHESCGRCHVNEYKSMHSNKYRDMWTKKVPIVSYMLLQDPGSGTWLRIQDRLPRYHASVLMDLAVNHTGGRFKFKEGQLSWNKVGGRLWDAIYDAHPEDGNQFKIYTPGTIFRYHKGTAYLVSANCMTCKTAEYILDWPNMGIPHEKAKFNQTTPPYELLKAVNYGMTCNVCHDPHSAEPRIVRHAFIRTLTDPKFKDNAYQADPNKTKIEVIKMGERGFERQIAILEKYDSKLQCGQCHNAVDVLGPIDAKTDQRISSEQVHSAFMGPDEYIDYYKRRGWYNAGKHPETGAKLIANTHPNGEIVHGINSKHGKAGVGCTDCHYDTEKDQKTKKSYKSHQVSFPTYKVQQTCLNANCHGKGSKQNWTEEDALYNIKAVQLLQRKRLAELDFNLSRLIACIVAAQRIGGIDASHIEKAKDAQVRAYAMAAYWFNDYSNGIHNPELSELSLTKAIQEAIKAYEELNKTLKEKAAAK